MVVICDLWSVIRQQYLFWEPSQCERIPHKVGEIISPFFSHSRWKELLARSPPIPHHSDNLVLQLQISQKYLHYTMSKHISLTNTETAKCHSLDFSLESIFIRFGAGGGKIFYFLCIKKLAVMTVIICVLLLIPFL